MNIILAPAVITESIIHPETTRKQRVGLQTMRPLPPVVFHPYRNREIQVSSGKDSIGCLYSCDGKIHMDRMLATALIARSIVTKDLVSMRRGQQIVERGYEILQRARMSVDFHRHEEHYSVIRRSLEIGRICRMKLPKRVIYRHLQSDRDYMASHTNRRPKTQKISYYWYLDQDLCRYLQIPYHNGPNNIRLELLRNFVCVAMTPATEPSDLQRTELKQLLDSTNHLMDTIYLLVDKEMSRRADYLIKGSYT